MSKIIDHPDMIFEIAQKNIEQSNILIKKLGEKEHTTETVALIATLSNQCVILAAIKVLCVKIG